jgi:membrane protein required for colicin V production
MNWLDIAILIILGLFVFGGLKNGLIRTVCSLAGMVAGITLAGRYYVNLAPALTFIPDLTIVNIAAFIIILVVILIGAMVLAAVLSNLAKAILLGWLNALLGGILGLTMGMVTISVLLTIWLKFRGPTDVITESAYAGALVDNFPFILSLLPDEFSSIRNFFR